MELSNKKKIACVGLLAMSASAAVCAVSLFQGIGDTFVDAAETEYTLSFSATKNKPTEGDVSSGSYIVETELGNQIRFKIGLGKFSESGFLTLGVGGTFGNPYDAEEENRNRISGILGITVTGDFQEGGLVLYTGFDADQGVSGSNVYPLKSGTEANPDFGYSFFQIKNAGTSACRIDSVSVRYSCVVQDASVADLTYELNTESTGYEITGYTGTGGDVVIPSAYKGLPVTSIGSYAFQNYAFLTSIDIPSSVTSVGQWAFSYCSSLKSVTFAEGSQLESIGDNAFSKCTSLTSIVIPSSVTSIGQWAFQDCISLTIYCEAESQPSGWNANWNHDRRPVVWGYNGQSGTTKDGLSYAVTESGGIEGVTITGYSGSGGEVSIPASFTVGGEDVPVTSIGDLAFYGCTSLTSVTFGEGSQLESIGSYAFQDCFSLTSIDIPSSVTCVGNQAFQDCFSLTSVTFGEGSQLKSIGSYAFCRCSSLTSIVIPSSVTSIGSCAFEGCTSLTSIVIPSSVTSIGGYAFYNCSLTIYCEAASKPDGWEYYWNDDRPVYWAGEWTYDDGVPTPKP